MADEAVRPHPPTYISSLQQPFSVVMVARSHTATHHLPIREGVTSTILAIKLANQLLTFGCRVMPFRLVNSKGSRTALIHAGRKNAIALSSNGCPYLHHNTSFVMLRRGYICPQSMKTQEIDSVCPGVECRFPG